MGGGWDTTRGARDEATVRGGGCSVRGLRPETGSARRRLRGLGDTEDELEDEKMEMAAGAAIILYGTAVAAEGGEEGREVGSGNGGREGI